MKAKVVKRICCMALATMMTLSAVACGSNKDANPTKNPTKTDGQGNSAQTSEIKYNTPASTIGHNGEDYANYDPYAGIEQYKGTTVKFATWIDHQQTEAGKVIDDFYEKYGIKVELVYCSQNKYVEEILSLISAGNAPDIYVENDTFPYTLQIAQDFSCTGVDLNEPIWDQAYLDACSVGDKVYAVNTVNSVWRGPVGITYNRELLEANGIKTPHEYEEEGNWTWETMKTVMQQVDALGDEYYGGSIPDPMYWAGTYGGGQFTYDHTTAKFTNTNTSSATVEAYQFVANLQKEGLTTNQETFTSGKAGLIMKDAYAIKRTGYYRTMDPLDLSFIAMPQKTAGEDITYYGMLRAYGIVNGAKNPGAAGYFLRYFLDPANYDLEDTFLSTDVANTYFELQDKSSTSATPMRFSMTGVAQMIGKSAWSWVATNDPSQIAAKLQTFTNEINTAISKSEELLNQKK